MAEAGRGEVVISADMSGVERDVDSAVQKSGSTITGGFGDAFGKVGDLATKAFAGIGIAAGAAVVGGLMGAIGQEASSDRLAAQMGIDNPDYAGDLGKIAGDLYANNFGASFEEAGQAIRATMQSGLLPEDATNEQIEAISGKVLNLADVFEQDLGGTAAAVGQMLKTGMAKDATEALDIITRGFQQGVDKRGDFLDTLNEYGTQFRKLGIDGATATGLLSQGLQAGARDADLVADALKEFSIRAVDGSEASAVAFRRLGLDSDDMTAKIARGGNDAKEGLQLILDKLKDVESPAWRAQIAVGLFGTQAEDMGDALYALDTTKAVGMLGNVAGAADRMGATLSDNASAKIETFKRQALQGLTDFIGGTVLPGLERFIPVVTKVVDSVVAKWPQIQAVVMPVTEDIVAFVAERWPEIQVTIEGVMTRIMEVISSVLELVRVVWDQWGTYILEFITSTFDGIMQVVNGALQIIQGVIQTVTAIISGDWGKAWEGVKMIFSGVWDAINGIVDIALARLKLLIQVGLDVLIGIVSAPLNAVAGIFTAVWDGIVAGIRWYWDTYTGIVRTGIDGVVGFVQALPGKVAEVARGAFDSVKEAFRSAINWIIRAWNGLEFRIPGFDPPGPGPSFGGVTIGVPNIPELAKGTDYFQGGMALVGEVGPELVTLPRGSDVTSNRDLRSMFVDRADDRPRRITGTLDLGNGLRGYVEGVLDDRDDDDRRGLVQAGV